LLPLRHGRMVRLRVHILSRCGSHDGIRPGIHSSHGMRVQCCGDAHLCNFGGFATPERRVIFAINDLDETHPAPWEWDVKRLAASFVVACRDKGLSDAVAKDIVMSCVRTYRESIAEFSELKTLELWYRALSADELIADLPPDLRKRAMKRIQKEEAKSRGEEMFPKLVEHKGEMPSSKISSDDLPRPGAPPGGNPENPAGHIQHIPRRLATLRANPARSLRAPRCGHQGCRSRSVGTACWVLLFMASENDPSFSRSRRLAPRCWSHTPEGASSPTTAARCERLPPHAACQRHFPGWAWTQTPLLLPPAKGHQDQPPRGDVWPCRAGSIRHVVRKGARALPRARRSSATLSGYMGKSDVFDRAIAAFSVAYADQNEKDYAALDRAVRGAR